MFGKLKYYHQVEIRQDTTRTDPKYRLPIILSLALIILRMVRMDYKLMQEEIDIFGF